MAIERTFSIIKPDATARNLTGAVNALIERAGLRIVAQKRIRMSRGQAETFYAVHKARPFFGELVEFMTSGPVVVQVLEGEGAIAGYRDVMGATDPSKAADGTIRKMHAKSIGENSVHGSDAPETAVIELAQFFSGNEIVGWSTLRIVSQGRNGRPSGLKDKGARCGLVVADLGSRERRRVLRPVQERDGDAGLLGRRRQDHLDQHPAVRRQRAGDCA